MTGSKIYLTIDDSPSPQTDGLTDFLVREDIPAVLFCRGDRLEQNFDPVVRAIEKGFVAGNHAYSHKRAGQMRVTEVIEEIETTEVLIEKAYKEAGCSRSGKHFRFPHMDRGCGGWVVDYNAVPDTHRETVIKLFGDGLNVSMSPPHEDQIERKAKLQDYLRTEGYTRPSCEGVTHKWFTETEIGQAVDAMFTFSTSDWMITPRHAGKWPYKTLDDLKAKIDNDPWLQDENSADIVLAHDQDGMLGMVMVLMRHMKDNGFVFV